MLPLPIRDGRTTREDRATHFLICETLSFAIVASQYLCRIIHLSIMEYGLPIELTYVYQFFLIVSRDFCYSNKISVSIG